MTWILKQDNYYRHPERGLIILRVGTQWVLYHYGPRIATSPDLGVVQLVARGVGAPVQSDPER